MSKKIGIFFSDFSNGVRNLFFIFLFLFYIFGHYFSAQKRALNSSPNQKSLKQKFCSTFKIGPKLLCFAVLRLKKFFDLRFKVACELLAFSENRGSKCVPIV